SCRAAPYAAHASGPDACLHAQASVHLTDDQWFRGRRPVRDLDGAARALDRGSELGLNAVMQLEKRIAAAHLVADLCHDHDSNRRIDAVVDAIAARATRP